MTEPDYFSKQVSSARRWFLDFPKPREKSLVTVSVGCEYCQPDYLVVRDDFQFECVEFVADGIGTVTLNNKEHRLQPGSVFHYGPGIPHRIANTGRRPMQKYFLDCGGISAQWRFRESSIGTGKLVQLVEFEELVELFELLIRNAFRESSFSAGICASLVESLLLKISEKSRIKPGADPRALATYRRVHKYMQDHFLHLRSIQEIARETGIDPAYLSRLFRRFHGSSPYRFLMRMKMSYAASLLLNPNTLVKQVAHELDFPDPFHFSRSFKSVYGISPEQFTKQGNEK